MTYKYGKQVKRLTKIMQMVLSLKVQVTEGQYYCHNVGFQGQGDERQVIGLLSLVNLGI